MKKTVIISLLFHAGLLIVFLVVRIPLKVASEDIFVVWDMVEVKPESRQQPLPKTENMPAIVTAEKQEFEVDETGGIAVAALWPDSLTAAPQDSQPDAIELNYSDFYLKKNLAERPPQDSSEQKIMPMWNGLPPLSDPIVGSRDGDIGTREMARRRQTYGKPVPLTDVGRALAQKLQGKAKPPTPRMRFIPTMAELDVLLAVWPHESITDQDVYRRLDASVHLTAEDVLKILKGLESKGVLSSELVSPRNEFTIATPLGSAGLEMSAQNRRNRIFRYKSLIDRQHMIRFLNAVLDQVQNRRGPYYQPHQDNSRLAQDLQDKIVKLVDE